jgi:hypothetical protein
MAKLAAGGWRLAACGLRLAACGKIVLPISLMSSFFCTFPKIFFGRVDSEPQRNGSVRRYPNSRRDATFFMPVCHELPDCPVL